MASVMPAPASSVLLAGAATPGSGGIGTGGAAIFFFSGGQGRTTGSTVEANQQVRSPLAFTATEIGIYINTNATVNPTPFALRKGGVTVATGNLAAGATGILVISCSVVIAKGDLLCLMLDVVTGGGACTVDEWHIRGT